MTLSRSYDEAMEHIKVTPEMRERILGNLSAAESAEQKQRGILRFPGWKRWTALAACFALALVGALGVPRLLNNDAEPYADSGFELVEADSAEELSELVGFAVQEPAGLPFEAEGTSYLAYGTELAEITCTASGETAVFRKSAGTEDVSGDYSEYSSVKELSVNGVSITLKGNDGMYALAVWSDGSFSYSLFLSDGMGEAAWTELLGANLGNR